MIFGITGNTTKDMVKGVIPDLLDWLRQKHIDYIIDAELLKYLKLSPSAKSDELCLIGDLCDVVLAFGGDGTILSTARKVGASGVPILGINLGGRLGFLAEVMIDELYDSLTDILNQDYTILERLVLEAKIFQQELEKTCYALNDVVIDRGGYSRVIRVEVFIDNEYLNTYLGDGIIIATPTGSTAYSLSAYGPILLPTLDCMIINPICPHSLGVRPVVIPDECEIRVVPHIEGKIITLSVDGQVSQQFSKNEGAEIIIRKAQHKIKWIRHKNRTFYDLLRTKLNWGADKRMF
ncbi:MAG: NAD(+)/NADH kinase [bacterium]|nr:MAG: NAD(+)/NADH kinase [bacterium]